MRIEHDIRVTRIYPFEKENTYISVSRPSRLLGDEGKGWWNPAMVNFPTFGEQDAKTIAQYAQALLVAARLCADFNGKEWPEEAEWDWRGKQEEVKS